jgi:hypothetical protein
MEIRPHSCGDDEGAVGSGEALIRALSSVIDINGDTPRLNKCTANADAYLDPFC